MTECRQREKHFRAEITVRLDSHLFTPFIFGENKNPIGRCCSYLANMLLFPYRNGQSVVYLISSIFGSTLYLVATNGISGVYQSVPIGGWSHLSYDMLQVKCSVSYSTDDRYLGTLNASSTFITLQSHDTITVQMNRITVSK